MVEFDTTEVFGTEPDLVKEAIDDWKSDNDGDYDEIEAVRTWTIGSKRIGLLIQYTEPA